MNEYSYESMFEKVKQEIPIKKSDKVYGVTFIGGPCFGKTYVANILAKKTGLYITANDRIRRIYDESGFNNIEYEADIKKMANDRTVYLLENRTSHIIDANMEFFWEMAENNFKNYNAKLYFVELKCDEEEVIRRINAREKEFGKDPNNHSRATIDDYYIYLERKKNKGIPQEKIFFTINTDSDNIEEQVDELIRRIEEDD